MKCDTAKGGALTLKPLDVAGKRIGLHLLQRVPQTFLVMPRSASDGLLGALSKEDPPGVGRIH